MLTTPEKTIDLGTLKYQETYRFEVPIHNSSVEAVIPTTITKGCGKCTQISMNPMLIPAKGVQVLKVSFTPDHTTYKDNKVTKSVTIHYIDDFGKSNTLPIYFQAKVVMP